MFSIHHTDHKIFGHKMCQRQIRRGVPRLGRLVLFDKTITEGSSTVTAHRKRSLHQMKPITSSVPVLRSAPSLLDAPNKHQSKWRFFPSNKTIFDWTCSVAATGRQLKIRKNITTSTIIVSSHQHQTNISSPSNNSGAFPILPPWLTKLM